MYEKAYLACLSMYMYYIIDFVVFWAYIGVIMLVIANACKYFLKNCQCNKLVTPYPEPCQCVNVIAIMQFLYTRP